MKKLVSIILLGVLLMNWCGYRIIADYYADKVSADMQTQLDNNQYTASDLITFKMPFSVPYGQSSPAFENVQGSVDINGVTYQYVKRRVYKDTLEVICIPNIAKSAIEKAKDEFGKSATEAFNLTTPKKTSNTHTIKFSIQDLASDHYFNFTPMNTSVNLKHSLAAFNNWSTSDFLNGIDQPPELS